jgi:hypothetical protein
MSEGARRLTAWQRIATVAALLGALFAADHLYGAQPLELLVTSPGQPLPPLLRMRFVRDGREQAVVVQGRSGTAATIVAHLKLRRGAYSVEAWPEPPDGRRFDSAFAFDGTSPVDVELKAR